MNAKLDNFEEMGKLLSVKNRVNHDIMSLFSQFSMGRVLCRLSLEKQNGISTLQLIITLCLFRINGESIHRVYRNKFYELLSTGKNCYYRILNRPRMDWRKFLWGMVMRFFVILRKENAEGVDVKGCLLIDDTAHQKRGKHMEFISWVFDHTIGKCTLGYKQLICAYTDGKTTIPVDTSIHREKGEDGTFGLSKKERRKQYHKKRSKKNPDYSRSKECDKSKLAVAIEMIKRAWGYGLNIGYVLADSWFTCEDIIAAVEEIGKGAMHYLGLAKMGNTKYDVAGHKHNVYELIALNERKIKTCRKYKCHYIDLRGKLGVQSVRIFIIRYGNNDKWNIMVTSDMNINFVKAFETYQLRWNIEVMIKECRQYLGLGTWQGRDLDGQIADCTLCFITYIVLALKKRFSDYETMGELFACQKEELIALTLWRRILLCLEKLMIALGATLELSFEDIASRLIANEESAAEIIFLAKSLEQFHRERQVPKLA